LVPQTESEPEKIARSFNPEGPWTGVWDVTGHRFWSGKWSLKQIDNKIVSTEKSRYKIEGLVVKGQLKGKIIKIRKDR
jgi:hypothetical protein